MTAERANIVDIIENTIKTIEANHINPSKQAETIVMTVVQALRDTQLAKDFTDLASEFEEHAKRKSLEDEKRKAFCGGK